MQKTANKEEKKTILVLSQLRTLNPLLPPFYFPRYILYLNGGVTYNRENRNIAKASEKAFVLSALVI